MSACKRVWMEFLDDESGMGAVEIILIICVIFTIYKGCK